QELGPCLSGWGDFGQSVALDASTIVVGEATAACVFVLANGTWSVQQTLTNSNGGEGFGVSVALSGDTVLVGAPSASGAGSAFVFVRASGTWTLQQQLASPTSTVEDFFGGAVAVEGDTAVVTSVDG